MSATRERIFGILLLLLAALMAVSLVGYSPADPPRHSAWPPNPECRHPLGLPGAWTAYALYGGLGFVAVPLLLGMVWAAVHLVRGRSIDQIFLRTLGILLLLLGGSGLAALLLPLSPGPTIGAGGYLGTMAKHMLLQGVTEIGAVFFLASAVVAGTLLAYDGTILGLAARLTGRTLPVDEAEAVKNSESGIANRSVASVSVATTPTTVVATPVFAQQTRHSVKNAGFGANGYGRKTATQYIEEDYEEYDDEEYDEDDENYDEDDCHEENGVDENDYEEYSESEECEECHEERHCDAMMTQPANFHGVSSDSPCLPEISQPVAQIDTAQKPQRSSGLFGWFFSGGNRDVSADGSGENGVVSFLPEAEQVGEENAETEDVNEYVLPEMEILTPSPPFDYDAYEMTVKRQARLLEKAFFDFGFNVKVVDIQTGPVIAQFEIQLEKGLRLNKIQGLTDDLAIALKVPSVRIVAPIPGKNTVGVEVPNIDRQIVRLRDVMEQSSDAMSEMAIPIYLGMDVTGSAMPIDMAKMPHLLIAGRTGTGKSVCLNSIIVSMLMTRRPDEVKMLMIDPKQVELSPYNTIPHLMHPVVTDMKKAEAILGWAVDKMEERYTLLHCAGVRHLVEYNKLSEEDLYKRIKPATTDQWDAVPKKMPYLVIVADEMSDLMLTGGKEVETHIIRLAQKSRAVGIHLILATQKPTVDVITGLIKSNLPARIAFGVASRSDSMVVIDRVGAEKLLGYGDMLFLGPGTSQVVRGQGTYVSDSEIEAIIAEVSTAEQEFAEELAALDALDNEDGFWEDYDDEESDEPSHGRGGKSAGKSQGKSQGKSGGKIRRDELYYKAVEQVIREGRGSVSLLQRKLGIGYGRASRMIDFMAEDGVVGEHNGSQARDVIISLSQWKRRMAADVEDIDRPKETRKVPAKSAGNSPVPSRKPTRGEPVGRERNEPEPKTGRRRPLRRNNGLRYEDERESDYDEYDDYDEYSEYDEPVTPRRRAPRSAAEDFGTTSRRQAVKERSPGRSSRIPDRSDSTSNRSPKRSPSGTSTSKNGSNRGPRSGARPQPDEPNSPKRKRPSLPARVVVSDSPQPIREARPQRGTQRVGRVSYYDYETEPYENYGLDEGVEDGFSEGDFAVEPEADGSETDDAEEWYDEADYDSDDPSFDTDEDY